MICKLCGREDSVFGMARQRRFCSSCFAAFEIGRKYIKRRRMRFQPPIKNCITCKVLNFRCQKCKEKYKLEDKKNGHLV